MSLVKVIRSMVETSMNKNNVQAAVRWRVGGKWPLMAYIRAWDQLHCNLNQLLIRTLKDSAQHKVEAIDNLRCKFGEERCGMQYKGKI